MKELASYLTNLETASAGFSLGKMKDDSGASDGTGITVLTHNDFYYAFESGILKYLGAMSDADESETASDNLDAMETMTGVKNPNVSEYDNSTAYVQDDHVMYLGSQYVLMDVSGSTGNNPIDSPDLWLPCFNRDEALRNWREGLNISGGFSALHDKRDVTNYRMIFGDGKYNYGGDAGRNLSFTGLHLDGTQVTGNATLEALLDVGGGDEYHLLDVIAPDVLGTRTLIETLARVGRVVDDTAGLTEDVGVVQEDAMQRITGEIATVLGSNDSPIDVSGSVSGVYSIGSTVLPNRAGQVSGNGRNLLFDSANSTSPNTAKTNDEETTMANYTKGVDWILIMQEI